MLRHIHIRDLLLIEALDLRLDDGLTILTGETGSGKSILIGALGLAMGERADVGVLRDPAKRCVIELEVDLAAMDLATWFEEQGLPWETTAILRRQIEPTGRSRAFINDTPVRLEQLRELAARLVHVHSQHHSLLLNDPHFQLGLVDHLAGQRDACGDYGKLYTNWRRMLGELEELRMRDQRAQAELDLLHHQCNELEEARLVAGEEGPIEADLSRAEHAGELIEALNTVDEGITGEEGLLALIARSRQVLHRPAGIDARVKELADRLASVAIELKDIAAEANAQATSVSLDPVERGRLHERLDLLLRLQQKYHSNSNEALLTLLTDLRERASAIGSMGERIAELAREEEVLRQRVHEQAAALSKARAEAVGTLGQQATEILHALGMPHAKLRFDHHVQDAPGPYGYDRVRAHFSANSDRTPVPLDKAASGGELSRVMLAIISLSADARELPTVVFDEIDTGVSGEVADRVGTLMARMARGRQVIAITHLPQIASKAQHHLLVSKQDGAGGVRTSIDPLDAERRVDAIARMLSGRKLTQQARDNARVLLKGK